MSDDYQQNVLNATRDEVIADLQRSISELEREGCSMNKIKFGNAFDECEGILISGNEAKRIIVLLKEGL
jgi:hypothetical protein